MRRVTIKEQETAIVVKNGKIVNILQFGVHWLFFGQSIERFQNNEMLITSDGSIFNSEILKPYIDLYHIADDELLLKFENQNFITAIGPGTHAFWKNKHSFHFQKVNIGSCEISDVSKVVLELPSMSQYVRNYRVESFENALLFIDGHFQRVLEPGNYFWWKNAEIITISKVDMRQQTLEIAGQEILTKDKVQLRINYVVHYKIENLIKAVKDNKDHDKQLYIMTQIALRNFVGSLSFDELMEQKNEIANQIFDELNSSVEALGVKIIESGIKDIILPGEIRDIMNQVLIAEKKSQANSIMRREETASTRSLLNTAKLMEDNQMLFKLKEMEYVERIAEKINSISVTGNSNLVSELKQIFTR